MLTRSSPAANDPIRSQLDRWRDRLIDLSRRSPLIAMRLGRRSHLRLSRPEIGKVFDRLARERADYRFWLPPEIATEPVEESDDTPRKRYRQRPDELLCEALERRELQHILTHLYRRARSDFQERGLRVLHVAFGLLEWKEVATGPTVLSPIVLLPVILERPRPGEPFILKPAEDDPFLNPALALRLQRDHHLRLPAFPDVIDENFRLGDYLDHIQVSTATLPDAKLERSAILTLLSFDKGVIHQDLTVNAESVVKHSFVRAIMGEGLPSIPTAEASTNDHLILDADASQESAITAARQGESFVLIGPPGTGKSQTIANLIADQLANGRTVLFVSEKIAALEVVYRRLRNAGLGDACLEVHSHQAQRARVVQELNRCLHLDDLAPPIDDESNRLSQLRAELDTVVAGLHERRMPLNRTAHDAAQVIAKYPELPLVNLNFADVLLRSREWFDEATRAVGRLTRLGHLFAEGPSFPWFGLRSSAFSLQLRDELVKRIDRVEETFRLRETARQQASVALGLGDMGSEWLIRAVQKLETTPRPPRAWFTDENLNDRVDQLSRCRQMRDGLRQHRQTLSTRYGVAVWQVADGSASRIATAWTPLRASLNDSAGSRIFPVLPALRQWIVTTRQLIDTWNREAKQLAHTLNNDLSTISLHRIERMLELVAQLQSSPVSPLRASVLERYEPGIFSLDLDRLIAKFAGPYQSLWKGFSGRYRCDCDALSQVSRSGTVPRDVLHDLMQARDVLRCEREHRSEQESRVRTLAGSLGFATVPTIDVTVFPPEFAGCFARLRSSIDGWKHSTQAISTLLPSKPMEDLSFAEWAKWLEQTLDFLTKFEDATAPLMGRAFPSDVSVEQWIDDLRQIELLRAWVRAEDSDPVRRREQFGPTWRGLEDTSWETLISACEWVREVKALFAPLPVSDAFIQHALSPQHPTSESLLHAERIHAESRDQLLSLFEPNHPIDLEQLRSRLDELPDWFDWRDLPAWLTRLGLEPLWRFVQQGNHSPETWSGLFEKAFFTEWLDDLCVEDRRLADFRGQEHDARIEMFRLIDAQQLKINSRQVMHRVRHRFTEPPSAPEVETLHRQALIRTRHRPLRQLFAEMPTLLQRLKPCLLMSPMSVSQFLTGGTPIRFDLVIFDEASQIPPEDAIGAIYRGQQTIIVGDDKQLPPTSFFQAEIGVAQDEPYPSILDQCRAVLPCRLLKWHYRSRDEALIAFSNRHFYDDRLMTFPSAHPGQAERGVSFHHVPDGVYDRGGRRQNRREAEVVADLVFEQLRNYPERTVGVIAFSQAQMSAIEDQLERRRRQQPAFEDFFRDDRLESVFVRNLETVQGDERDVIFLSVGYGKDQRGKPSLNFGPLNRSGGERRLNVAVTRAREKLVLVSSLTASELAGRSTAEGIRLLRRYLEYAQGGLAQWSKSDREETTSVIWADVRSVVEEWGYSAEPGVGCSAGRVELGIIDPKQPGRFLLGVLGDGGAYRTSGSATERDRLRPAVLRSLGWRLHTIWTLDWIRRREPELARLRESLERAKQEAHGTLRQRRRGHTLPTG